MFDAEPSYQLDVIFRVVYMPVYALCVAIIGGLHGTSFYDSTS